MERENRKRAEMTRCRVKLPGQENPCRRGIARLTGMTWRTIPGLPMYEASNTGLIRSKARSVRAHVGVKTYRRVIPGKFLEARRRVTDGREHYLDIKIGGVNRYVHRLVAMAWHPDTWFEGAEVNHINGDTYDNRACNLEWVTRSENLLHSYRVLGRNARKAPADARGR